MTPERKFSRILSVVAISLLLIASFSYASAAPRKIIEEVKFLMGTDVRIKVPFSEKEDENRIRAVIDKAFDEIRRIEEIFSVYNPDSEISRINRLRMNKKLVISHETFGLIKKSVVYSEKTQGAFDITVKPLADLWNKAKELNRLPGEEEVKLALAQTGYKKIILDEKSYAISFAREGMALDLGAAAKGYATDRAVQVLKKNGIKDAVLSSGGDIYCLGTKSGREQWKVGVRHPRNKDKIFLEISLKDRAIDTSGDYEKYFILDGKRYSHIIDPRTGYPVGDNVVSSTVIAPDAVSADILATALEVLGHKGMAIAESIGGIDAIMVLRRNNFFITDMTEGIRERYDIREEKDL